MHLENEKISWIIENDDLSTKKKKLKIVKISEIVYSIKKNIDIDVQTLS